MQKEVLVPLSICAGCVLLIILIIGWDVVEVTNWGLKCNSISKQCNKDEIYSPGRYLVGPFNSFFNFPGQLQTIEFSDKKGAQSGPLKTRTAEGLSLGLHVSFQYQLIRKEIPQLYSMNGLAYEQTFIRMARDTILQAAGKFEAPKYWQERAHITQAMLDQLALELKKGHAECVHLQILDIELPDSYEQSIVNTQIEVQKRTMKQFEQKAQLILNEIMVLRSDNEQQIYTINAQAHADAFQIVQNATATSNKMLLEAESQIYKKIQDLNKFTDEELMEFIYWQSVMKQKQAKLVLGSKATLTYNMNNK
ncbi:hypothetical protein pb186bvf_012824 [Paramecium bursaria]